VPPRTDFELEALLEILDGERLVHSHSYRADEILMLVRLAEELGFRVATFQHALESYKVAAEVARHGAGASMFSDWWAYKYEVVDAIPWAGAIDWQKGVLVSYNSDSSELARRMNLEAAKAVRYGGVPEEEALRFVTINPARQLRVDARVGSLEPGKDADFAIWSGHPLDTTSLCLETWIEGRKYFDRAADLALRPSLEAERAALIAKAKAEADAEKKPKSEEPAAPTPDAPAPVTPPQTEVTR
jgi:imidazolonepropionase-like amidohydrolase